MSSIYIVHFGVQLRGLLDFFFFGGGRNDWLGQLNMCYVPYLARAVGHFQQTTRSVQ